MNIKPTIPNTLEVNVRWEQSKQYKRLHSNKNMATIKTLMNRREQKLRQSRGEMPPPLSDLYETDYA